MAEDPSLGDRFDALVASLDPAMVVVTTASGDERDGCLVGFHSQSSIEPRRYVVWLSVVNRTYGLAGAATHVAVHALGATDGALAERFGGTTGDEVDKLADLDWVPGPGGVPLLADLPHRFVGRIVERTELAGGDHLAVVVEPVSVDFADGTDGAGAPYRLSDASAIEPGHPA